MNCINISCVTKYKMFLPPTDSNNNLHFSFKFIVSFFIFSYMLLGYSSLILYACIVYARQIEQISSIIFRPIICGVKYFDYSVSQIASVVETRGTNGNDIDKDDFDFHTFFNLIHAFRNKSFTFYSVIPMKMLLLMNG